MRSVLPRAVQELAMELNRLPGIGPKSAKRLAIYLLRQPYPKVAALSDAMKNLHANVRSCSVCFNLGDAERCAVCADEHRDAAQICLVEDPLDIEAIERADVYQGVYHVLGGVLSPMNGIGPEQLALEELFRRLEGGEAKELIIGLDQTLEGEATAHYIMERLKDFPLIVSRLARGLPTGGDVEFADAMTLSAALSGRRQL